jgi:hypothetical protein
MSINNEGSEVSELFNYKTKSMNQLAVIVVCATALVALVVFFVWRTFFTDIPNTVELFQGVLVCSTALMGLSGLMIIEIKKTNVSGLSSQDMSEKVNAMNAITSLGGAFVSLRWVLFLSIVCIMLSIVQLMTNNSFLTVVALGAFLDQIYLFIWGLVFLDLLPS